MSPFSRTPPSPPPPSLFPLLKFYPFLSSPYLYLMMYLLVHFRFIIAVTVPLFLSLLLRPLLTHFLSLQVLLPRLCLLLITCPLLFGKVIAILAILILFTIFVSYHRLSSPYSAFVSTISSVSLPKNTNEALSHSG